MKKVLYTVVILAIGVSFLPSCKKEYHCQCTYNNQLVRTVDMGNQTSDNAKKCAASMIPAAFQAKCSPARFIDPVLIYCIVLN